MIRFQYGDLVLASDTPLPALLPAPDDVPESKFRLLAPSGDDHSGERWDHHWRSPEGAISLSCARDGDAYRLGFPGLATFRIEREGREIACRPNGELPPSTIQHLLVDQVLPRVLTHRGRLVIHAGCAATSIGAIAFLGDSGAGKSTLCASLALAGTPLLGDDAVVVRPSDPGEFTVEATYPALRLLPESVAHHFGNAVESTAVARTTEKLRVPGATFVTGPLPLRRLYVLSSSGPHATSGEVEIAPLPERQAFLALLRASFQLHLDDQERSRGLFLRIGALLDAVPVRRLSYPREFSRLADVHRALRDDA